MFPFSQVAAFPVVSSCSSPDPLTGSLSGAGSGSAEAKTKDKAITRANRRQFKVSIVEGVGMQLMVILLVIKMIL